MAKTKAASTAPPAITEADALKAMQLLAKTKAELDALNGKKKQQVLALDEKYAESIGRLEKAAGELETVVLTFLKDNRESFLGDAKSKKFGSGTLGVRIGNQKLVLAGNGLEWSDVVKLAQEKMPEYVREDWVLQKDKLLSDFGNDPDANDKLLDLGVAIVQEEKLFVKI